MSIWWESDPGLKAMLIIWILFSMANSFLRTLYPCQIHFMYLATACQIAPQLTGPVEKQPIPCVIIPPVFVTLLLLDGAKCWSICISNPWIGAIPVFLENIFYTSFAFLTPLPLIQEFVQYGKYTYIEWTARACKSDWMSFAWAPECHVFFCNVSNVLPWI